MMMTLTKSPLDVSRGEIDQLQYFRLDGAPNREFYVFVPGQIQQGVTPLVLVHGISRNAVEIAMRFAPLAEQLGVPIIAPLFRKESYGMYQQVIDRSEGHRADLALFDILDHVALRWPIDTRRIWLFGFSGGAQFAHRFAFFHPERVDACIPVSAGWYCWPDENIRWPLGLSGAPIPIGDKKQIAAINFHVIVGRQDTKADEALRRSAKLDGLQGADRLQRARGWSKAMRTSGYDPDCGLTVLPRARHNFNKAQKRGLVQLAFSLLGFSSDNPWAAT